METIINNPGLQNIAEEILFNLNYKNLKKLSFLNRRANQILNDPFFWLKKLIQRGLSKKNQEDWTKAIQLTESNSELKRFVSSYLKMSTKNEKVIDVSCYIDEEFLANSAKKIMKYLKTKNPNAPDKAGYSV